jgi:hypothetical protein
MATWLYVVRDERRTGHALVTPPVRDLNKTVQDIAGRTITGSPIEIVGDSGRNATLTDTDGNSTSFIEVSASGS